MNGLLIQSAGLLVFLILFFALTEVYFRMVNKKQGVKKQ